jgi:hypothetical protein
MSLVGITTDGMFLYGDGEYRIGSQTRLRYPTSTEQANAHLEAPAQRKMSRQQGTAVDAPLYGSRKSLQKISCQAPTCARGRVRFAQGI